MDNAIADADCGPAGAVHTSCVGGCKSSNLSEAKMKPTTFGLTLAVLTENFDLTGWETAAKPGC